MTKELKQEAELKKYEGKIVVQEKTELQKEAENYLTQNCKRWEFDSLSVDDIANEAYLASAEPREKRIEELEEKIGVLLSCKNCPENKGGLLCQKEYEDKCLAQKIQYIKELREENAELRKVAEFQQSSNMNTHLENKKIKEVLAVVSTWNKHLNSLNKALEEERDKYRNMVFDKDEELNKWKDEWQEQVQKATDEGYARTLQTIQLTKAKELLKNLLSAYTSYADSFDDRDNQIVTEAEQFLEDSEVEK